MVTQTHFPVCPHCQREFVPGTTWFQANFCRLAFLIPIIEQYPGETAWQLAQRSGLVYADASAALAKGRAYNLFLLESEQRDNGGVRYRYRATVACRPFLERVLGTLPWEKIQ